MDYKMTGSHFIIHGRKGLDKEMKRTNSLPLSPVVFSYAALQGKTIDCKADTT